MPRLARVVLPIFFLLLSFSAVFADELLDVQKQIDQKNKEYSTTQNTIADIKKQIASLSGSLVATKPEVDLANKKVSDIRSQLQAVENDLAKKRDELSSVETVRDQNIRFLYKYPGNSPIELFVSSGGFSDFSQALGFQKRILGTSKDLISSINSEIASVEKTRSEVAAVKAELEKTASDLNARYAAMQSQLAANSSRQKVLSNKVSVLQTSLKELNDKQNQILAAKLGSSISTGNLTPASDPNSAAGFNPGFSPAFAAFSFGAFTHRNGMSQYGALGRAQRGQNAEQILAAYYPSTSLNKNYPLAANITVNGTNEYGQTFNNEVWNFEEYVKHLYEVPSSWPMEVLKAQAVAARSYAVRHTNNGQSAICPSQSCQVVKREINASSWQQAVEATRGWVLTGSGSFQYSSTSGGYLNTSGWDTTSGNIGTWPGEAYENIAGSPWFYKGWYKTLSGATCGRSHPWLSEEQFADVLNSWVVYTNGSGNDKARVSTWDTGCWGGNPYSIDEMRSRAGQLGGAFNRVYGVTTQYSSGGFASSVSVSTDRGAVTIDGPTFRDIFNLRAPGHLVIRTALYNIEKK